jgi:type IX secretion system PorP/SprF family membrane protein
MKRKAVVLLFAINLLLVDFTFSQDPEFSQFYANPLYLNPALAGATICPLVIGNYRNQWPSLGKAFTTYNFSYDQYFDVLHGGLGFIVTADRAGGGNLNTTEISLIYAFKFNITDKIYASTAVKAGYYQRHLAWDNLTFEDMIDPQNGFVLPTSEKAPDNSTVGVPDFSAGLFMGYENIIYGGVAVDHLSQPSIGFYSDNSTKLNMKITAHAGSVIPLKSGPIDEEKEFSISPNVLYQQQYKFHQLNIGVSLTIQYIIAGVWFRHNFENADAIIPMLGMHYKNLRIGISYDYTISKLKSASGGAYEASASWQFPCIEKRRHIKAIKCPRF